MQGDEAKEIAVSKSERADFLAQAERINAGAVGCLEMFDRLPLEARVPVDCTPVELAQAAQRRDNLLQLRGLEARKDVLERGTVEVEPGPTSAGGHASGARPWTFVRRERRRRSRSESLSRPRRDRA